MWKKRSLKRFRWKEIKKLKVIFAFRWARIVSAYFFSFNAPFDDKYRFVLLGKLEHMFIWQILKIKGRQRDPMI